MIYADYFNASLLMRIKSVNIFMLICLLVALVKLFLISKNEIVVMPHDAEAYVSRSMQGLWHIGLMHSGYPIWLRLINDIGLPQRLAIEFLYLGSCFFVSSVIRHYVHKITATLVFLVLALAPFTFFLFDQALSDGFYICLTLFALGFSFKLLCSQQLKSRDLVVYASALGFMLGLMLITRAEDQLITFWIFAVTATFAVFRNVHNAKLFSIKFWYRPVYLFIILVITSFLILNIVSTVFYVKDGIFARSVTLLPQHYKLLDNLARIDTGVSQDRYIPISKASRELAYEVSPVLNGLREDVENTGNILHAASKQAGLPEGEIGAGWIWWAFLGATNATLPGAKPTVIEDLFKKVNDELDLAFSYGRLQKRFILNPLIGGNLSQLFSDLPSGILVVLNKIFSSYPYVSDQAGNPDVFNKACNRRAALVGQPDRVVLQGWVFPDSPDTKVLSVLPQTTAGGYGEVTYHERVDVSDGYKKLNGWRPEVYGFRAEIESGSIEDVTLAYLLSDGTIAYGETFTMGKVFTIEGVANSGSNVVQGIDIAELVSANVRNSGKHGVQLALARYMESGSTIIMASVISIIFLVLAVIKVLKVINSGSYNLENVFVFQFFLLLVFGARILFYSLIETASWHVEIRYLASAQALFFVFISISFVAIVSSLRDRNWFKGF